MSNPFVGEIRLFAGNFAPSGWSFCDGALLSIADNDVLFNLIGTTYGGDGQTTFALPDLRGRLPIHQGTGQGSYVIGQRGGAETVTLTANQMPVHAHALRAAPASASLAGPGPTALPAAPLGPTTTVVGAAGPSLYVVPGSSPVSPAAMAAGSIATAGGGQPHENMMPFLAINYIISLFGVYPSQN